MPTPSHPKHPCFMKDFAAHDLRSAHAHLRNQSRRARAYLAFEAMSRLLGRGQRAPEDYRLLSRWLYRHRETLTRCTALTCKIVIALTGTASGMVLYWIFQR